MRLQIHKETTARIPRARIQKVFEMIADEEAEPGSRAGVNLIFTTDEHIRLLNRDFRHKDKATDVLSFPLEEAGSADATFGEIYVSVETADRQAATYGGTRSEEYVRLVCHGLLHLFGYDHMKPDEEAVMKEREERYLSRVWGK